MNLLREVDALGEVLDVTVRITSALGSRQADTRAEIATG